jgi:hypothetical protein
MLPFLGLIGLFEQHTVTVQAMEEDPTYKAQQGFAPFPHVPQTATYQQYPAGVRNMNV